MSAHKTARQDLEHSLVAAQQAGYDETLYLRALLSAVVERSKHSRSLEDLQQELRYLAENLDDEADYSFMRP